MTTDPDKLWQQWKASPSPKALSAVVGSLSDQLDKIVASNPGLSDTLVRSKGRNMLLGAIKSYDPSFGTSIKTHAHNHLKPLASRGYTMARAVPRTRYREDIARSIHNELLSSEEQGEPEPNAKELAKRLKLPIGTVEHFLSGQSYEMPEGSLESTPMSQVDNSKVNFWTEMVYHDMSPIQQKIFDLRSGKGGSNLTLGQVAEATGVSPSYVHKVTTDASKKIMKGVNSPSSVIGSGELEDEPEPPMGAADMLNESLQ